MVVLVLVRYAGLVPGPGPAHGHLVTRHTLGTWIKHTGNHARALTAAAEIWPIEFQNQQAVPN